MSADPRQLPLWPDASSTPNLLDVSPRRQLWIAQGMACPGCDATIAPTALAYREGEFLSALLCRSCLLQPERVPRPLPIEKVPALLRLRLRSGGGLAFPRRIADYHRQALDDQNWEEFRSPLHALYVQQRGCALTPPRDSEHNHDALPIAIDYDRDSGAVLGLLCLRCRASEHKGVRVAAWNRYRQNPPGQQCLATRGLTRAYVQANAAARMHGTT